MEIAYLGHSAFRLRGKDVTIVTDPHPPDAGNPMGKVQADVVTVSHDSPNHNYLQGVTGSPRIVRGPGEYEVADVLIAGVATAVEPMTGPRNTAYVLRFDDLSVCHLGDLSGTLTDKQLEEIGDVDIIFLPVGGGDTLDPTVAAQVVTQLEPKLVVPMHYRLDGGRQELAPVDHFLREMGSKEVTPEPRLTVTRSSLPGDMRVSVLQARTI